MLPLRYTRSIILIGLTLITLGNAVVSTDERISEQEGRTVVIPCPVNKQKCGELHSVNWFKGDNRIVAMLLDEINATNVVEEYADRVTAEQSPFQLTIRDLKISDEDTYLCDTTFYIPIETCDNFNGYRTELNVLVPPSEIVILDEKGDRIENGTVIGPLQERQMLKASCVVHKTRPQPQVGWWRGNKRLTTHSPSYDEVKGLYTATLELALQLSRDDLGHNIECRVDSSALADTLTNQFSVDLQVRPTSITINGVEHHTVQGSKVVLTCDIHGARPPVNVTWYNSTDTISPIENDLTEIRTKAFEKEDGTYHTQSELIFNATRFENDMTFRCDAENVIIQINREKPFTSSLTLEVLYPPVVKVSPTDITVNTSDTVLLNCEYVANPASLTRVVWYRNDDIVNVNNTERYEGGNSENVALVIRSTDKTDIGNYSCELWNDIGKGKSDQQISLDVQYVPIVEVIMIPEGPVRERDETNVTLYCNILDANPALLTKVRWYANSSLLKELPDCEEAREDLCHIDPSKLLLESIGRGFFYNYSCEGYNAAGWGPRSEDRELLVHYEPGPATLSHFPMVAIKKKSVTFSCNVDDPGFPEATRYRWMRGGRGPLQDVVTKDWTIEPIGLDSRTNYSCYAYNEGGQGVNATVHLDVFAPPFFIKNLSPYSGVLHSTSHANLTCRIECIPRCEISWFKDGAPIESSDNRYFVKHKYMDASPATGDFESMLSVLHFNMSNWPNKSFDIENDNGNYTCESTANTIGPGIRSSTYFSIEYPPDNTTVSEDIIYVQENTVPGRVICKSKANPEPSYKWMFNNKTVIRSNALIINTPMTRNLTGNYTCVAFNKHGNNTARTFVDVQYKPRCEITRKEINDQDTLICTAYGNPLEADFSWSIKSENESIEFLGNGEDRKYKDKSYFILEEDYVIARTYRCVANNTAGAGAFCEIEVAEQLSWWQRWDKTTLIILVAGILILLLAVIIICCIIICICRRRRRQDKYHTDVSISATQSVLSYQPTTTSASTPTATPTPTPASMAQIGLPPVYAHVGAKLHHQQQQQANMLISSMNAQFPANNNNAAPSGAVDKVHAADNNNIVTPANDTAAAAAATTISTATLSPIGRPIGQAPKSPPRWPLRPGVMVHVSSDTKENLAINRMTLKPFNTTITTTTTTATATINDSTVSSSSGAFNTTASTAQTSLLDMSLRQTATLTLGRINSQRRRVNHSHSQSHSTDEDAKGSCTTNTVDSALFQTFPRRSTTNSSARINADNAIGQEEEQAQFRQQFQQSDTIISVPQTGAVTTTTAATTKCNETKGFRRVEHFFVDLFKRSKRSDTTRDSQRSHVGLLAGMLSGAKGFWRHGNDNDSSRDGERNPTKSSPFGCEHRLKGIRCSGSVTYKKTTPELAPSIGGSPAKASAGNDRGSRPQHSSDINNTTTTTTTDHVDGTLNVSNTNTNTTNPIDNRIATAMTQAVQVQSQLAHQSDDTPHQSHASVTFPMLSYDNNNSNNNNNNTIITNTNTEDVTPTVWGNATTTTTHHPLHTMSTSTTATSMTPAMSAITTQPVGTLKSPMKCAPPPRPPPPFRAAPPPLRKRTPTAPTTMENGVQINDKSSTLGDPLTEPGEYENLPFHGLQTAPNKCPPTTPTSFNGSGTNVVRVAPRSLKLNHNDPYYDDVGADDDHQIQIEIHQPPRQMLHADPQQQQFQIHESLHRPQQHYNTLHYGRGGLQYPPLTAGPTQAIITAQPSKSDHSPQQQQQQQQHHQITYNLNNIFPKSYTEYFQQQQQCQNIREPPTHPTASRKLQLPNSGATMNAQLLNAIEDYPAYAVVDRSGSNITAVPPLTLPPVSTNPFLAASNFKKYDTNVTGYTATQIFDDLSVSCTGTAMQQQRKQTFMDRMMDDKRFHSLKFNGSKRGGGSSGGAAVKSYQPNKSLIVDGSPSSDGPKCKRHHSFAGGSIGDIDSRGPHLQHERDEHIYDPPPVYENVSDTSLPPMHPMEKHQLLMPTTAKGGTKGAASVLMHAYAHPPQGGGFVAAVGHAGQKKKHHHRQHQQKDDFNMGEPERLSIYRSDSGISNSSYECVTPVPPPGGNSFNAGATPPPPKTAKTPKTPKTPKSLGKSSAKASTPTQHKGIGGSTMMSATNYKKSPRTASTTLPTPTPNFSATTTVAATSAPVYMNVQEDGQQKMRQRSCSPIRAMGHSSYESGSSSQNDYMGGACSTDPTSLSSCNSVYSSGISTLVGSATSSAGKGSAILRCNRHPTATTPDEYEQYTLGHNTHQSLSGSSLSAQSAGGSSTASRKCKKRPTVPATMAIGERSGHSESEQHLQSKSNATNPFLARNHTTTAATAKTTTATTTATAAVSAAIRTFPVVTDGQPPTISTCNRNRKFRRQTICDPYAHISRYFDGANGVITVSNATDAHQQHNVHQHQQYTTQQQQQQQRQQSQYNNTVTHTPKQCGDNSRQHSFNALSHTTATAALSPAIATIAPTAAHTPGPLSPALEAGGTTKMTAAQLNYEQHQQRQRQRHPSEVLSSSANRMQQIRLPKVDTDDDDDDADDEHDNLRLQRAALPSVTPFEPTTMAAVATVSASDWHRMRPVKFPLRKHHSFHFQPSQTVTGIQNCRLQQLRMQIQQTDGDQLDGEQQNINNNNNNNDNKAAAAVHLPRESTATTATTTTNDNNNKITMKNSIGIRANEAAAAQGPLVFRPLALNANRSFKPISPPAAARALKQQQQQHNQNPSTRATESATQIRNVDDERYAIYGCIGSFNMTANRNFIHANDDNGDGNARRYNHVPPQTSAHSSVAYDDDDNVIDVAAESDTEEITSEMSEELSREIKRITQISTKPNPAASLEALENLTRVHPDFMGLPVYPVKHNQQNTQRQQQQQQQQSVDKQPTAKVEDDDEDLGYSFCEDDDENAQAQSQPKENVDNDDEEDVDGDEDDDDDDDQSPNATVIITTNANGSRASPKVRYIMTQSSREVHV